MEDYRGNFYQFYILPNFYQIYFYQTFTFAICFLSNSLGSVVLLIVHQSNSIAFICRVIPLASMISNTEQHMCVQHSTKVLHYCYMLFRAWDVNRMWLMLNGTQSLVLYLFECPVNDHTQSQGWGWFSHHYPPQDSYILLPGWPWDDMDGCLGSIVDSEMGPSLLAYS